MKLEDWCSPENLNKIIPLLVKSAKAKRMITYTEAGRPVGLAPHDVYLWSMLGEISHLSYKENGIFLSAVVWNVKENRSGNGLFDVIYAETGKLASSEDERLAMWSKEVNKVHQFYSEES